MIPECYTTPLVKMGCPRSAAEAGYGFVVAAQAHNTAVRLGTEKGTIPVNETFREVLSSPDYFINEGGADGTFGHVRFHDMYGPVVKPLVKFAVAVSECGDESERQG